MHGYVLFNLAACIPKTHKKKLLPVRLNQFICHALDTAKIVVIRIKNSNFNRCAAPLPFATPIYMKYDEIFITVITLYAMYFKTVKIFFII